jgi:hypothetical protein
LPLDLYSFSNDNPSSVDKFSIINPIVYVAPHVSALVDVFRGPTVTRDCLTIAADLRMIKRS